MPNTGSITTPVTLLHREVWNRGDLALVDDLVTEDYRHTDPLTSSPITGPTAFKTHIDRYRSVVPDLEKEVAHILTDEDTVVLAYTATGTLHPPTLSISGSFTVPGAYIGTVTDGRITRGSDIWDALTILASTTNPTDNHQP